MAGELKLGGGRCKGRGPVWDNGLVGEGRPGNDKMVLVETASELGWCEEEIHDGGGRKEWRVATMMAAMRLVDMKPRGGVEPKWKGEVDNRSGGAIVMAGWGSVGQVKEGIAYSSRWGGGAEGPGGPSLVHVTYEEGIGEGKESC